MSMSKTMLIGRVGQTPEINYMQSGKCIANLSLATSKTWKDKDGTKQEHTEWHKIVIFGKLAEIVGEYVDKGSMIYLEGENKTESWEDEAGNKRYATKVYCNIMKMLSAGSKEKRDSTTSTQKQQPQQTNSFDDDIPF